MQISHAGTPRAFFRGRALVNAHASSSVQIANTPSFLSMVVAVLLHVIIPALCALPVARPASLQQPMVTLGHRAHQSTRTRDQCDRPG